jgi:nitroreductase
MIDASAVEQAMLTRRSVRGFLPDPVPRALVERLLELAARAASNTNIQPWKVYVIAGAARDALCEELVAAHAAGEPAAPEYRYFPEQWRDPYLARRRKVGWDLYGLLGIAKGDREGTRRQHARNYRFFGAPVGLFFTIERDHGQGSWIDVGAFMQGLMIAARAHGLDTCAQAAFIDFHPIVRRHLAIPPAEILVCGMALGRADPDEKANALTTEREPVSGFARFHGDWDPA